jgi:hypothetical protein
MLIAVEKVEEGASLGADEGGAVVDVIEAQEEVDNFIRITEYVSTDPVFHSVDL